MAAIKGGNKQTVKIHNRGLVMRLIATEQYVTRPELTKHVGLSKMTLSNIVTEMIEGNVIIECEKSPNAEVGRNPVKLNISPKAVKSIGVLIFRDRIETVLCDFRLNIIERITETINNITKEQLISIILKQVRTILSKGYPIIGIGISTIGPIDKLNGKIIAPYHFYGIENVDLVSIMEEEFKLPVFMDHDNQSAALAEMLYGAGRNFKDFMLVGIAQGIGCGIVVEGDLYDNYRGLAPEFGHVSINMNGKKCVCGNQGCIETYVSIPVIMEQLKIQNGYDKSFEEYCIENSWETRIVLNDAMMKLASALVNSINLLNPELILLAFESVLLPDEYLQLLEKRINQIRFSRNKSRIIVRKVKFGRDAPLVGAACNVFDQVFRGELVLLKSNTD